MCIIVDANRLGDFFAQPTKPDAQPIHDWLRRGGKLIYSNGGKFRTDIGARIKAKLADYVRAGRADLVPYTTISGTASELRDKIKSDDPHVLALALYAKVRVLYTHDGKLVDDFKNKRFIDRPRGTIYTGAGNSNLLTPSLCRGRYRRTA